MYGHTRTIHRRRRQARVRRKIRGTDERPRLTVFRSARHIYVQVISDESGRTLLSASTLARKGEAAQASGNVEAAKAVGETVAQRCLERSIRQVVFDRNGFLFHGRVRALAEAARAAGLEF